MSIKLVCGKIENFSMSAFWTNVLLESFQGQLGSEATTNWNYLEYEHKKIRKGIFSWYSMIGLLHDITWVFCYDAHILPNVIKENANNIFFGIELKVLSFDKENTNDIFFDRELRKIQMISFLE